MTASHLFYSPFEVSHLNTAGTFICTKDTACFSSINPSFAGTLSQRPPNCKSFSNSPKSLKTSEMRPTLATLLLLHFQSFLVLGLQSGSSLPKFVRNLSSNLFGHSAYVDQRVHHTPRSFLNHEQWHQRHMLAFVNASSVTYLTMPSQTRNPSTKTLGSSLPLASTYGNFSGTVSRVSALSSASVSTNSSSTGILTLPFPSASATPLQGASLASLLGGTETLEADTSADWDDQTESACSTALIALHGVATNPSGIAACYNIRSLDQSTGIFDIDLRLYRISAPREGWVKLDASSVGVGLSYANATVSATKAKKSKRNDWSLPWFPAQKDEAADIFIRRSIGVPPRRLESMTFVGTVDEGLLAELKDE